MAQLVAHLLCKQRVAGSNPASSTGRVSGFPLGDLFFIWFSLIKGELSDGGPVVNDDAAARELRWRMKALQWGASSLPSIRCCSRSPRPASTGGEGQLSVMQIGEGTEARRYISGL